MGAPELTTAQRNLLMARHAIQRGADRMEEIRRQIKQEEDDRLAANGYLPDERKKGLTQPDRPFYRYLDGVEPDMRDYEMAGQVLALCEEVYVLLGKMQASINQTRLPVSLVVPADLLAFEAGKCVQVIRHKQARMAFHERWRQPPSVRMLAKRKPKPQQVAA
ncbi:hypothetical protein LHK_02621 [Laribacter hongkongensis HLHK9]|uniref:Uncharacterized protein n=1 Tax=Laribacter hongkongensis (strain HLHK9) TaxID=557598 RepID=C1DCI3_LARHH|nr:hypothetical protein [Laribacter hongkongensis]ACO75602.1 hypothetical protein LHK_02621 [Laribacter hongkongensis HLHK9]